MVTIQIELARGVRQDAINDSIKKQTNSPLTTMDIFSILINYKQAILAKVPTQRMIGMN